MTCKAKLLPILFVLLAAAGCRSTATIDSEALSQLEEWRGPKVRFDDVPMTVALKRLQDWGPKDADGRPVFRYRIIPFRPKQGLRDATVSHTSNRELFGDLLHGWVECANWSIDLKNGVFLLSDKPIWLREEREKKLEQESDQDWPDD